MRIKLARLLYKVPALPLGCYEPSLSMGRMVMFSLRPAYPSLILTTHRNTGEFYWCELGEKEPMLIDFIVKDLRSWL